MTLENELFTIERGFWEKGEAHFRAHMDETCLISFADMAGVKTNAEIAAMASDAPSWEEIDIVPKGFVRPVDDVAMINYAVGATREGGDRHHAIVTTGYVRRDSGWKAVFHGQALLPD